MLNTLWAAMLALCLPVWGWAYSTTSVGGAPPLRVAAQSSVLSVDPHAYNERFNNAMVQHIYEPLVVRSATLQMAPGLAVSWQQEGPQQWLVRLREGVRFHHGAALGAEDVVFSIQRAQHTDSTVRGFAQMLGKPVAMDGLTVRFHTPQPQPLFAELLTLIPIMSRAWTLAQGLEHPVNAARRVAHREASGTGPFKLVGWQPGERIELQRNPHWWGEAAGLRTGNVEQASVQAIQSGATRMAALRTGEVDLVLDVPPGQSAWWESSPQLHSVRGLENRIIYLGLDVASPVLRRAKALGRNPLQKVEVRQALVQAINWPALQAKALAAEHVLASVMVPANVWGHPGGQSLAAQFELQVAREALAQAGFAQGFELEMGCPSDRNPTDEVMCKAIAAMWTRLGLQVHLSFSPKARYFDQLDESAFDVFLMGWGGATSDAVFTLRPLFHTRQPDGAGLYNYGGVSDSQLDGWMRAADQELNPTVRVQLLQQALLRIQQQAYVIPLYQQSIHWSMRQGTWAHPRPDARLELFRVLQRPASGNSARTAKP